MKHWAAASGMVALGYAAYALVNLAPSFVPIVIGNSFFVIGMFFVTNGALTIVGRRIRAEFYIAGIILSTGLFLFFGYIVPSFAARNIVVSLAVSVCSAVSASVLLNPGEPEKKRITVLGAGVFIAYAIFYFARSVLLLMAVIRHGRSGSLPVSWELCLMLLALMLFVVLGVSIFTMMGGFLVLDLEKSLVRNSLLLNEVQHRTKNNLALAGSLISLQEDDLTDPAAKSALQELQKRLDRNM